MRYWMRLCALLVSFYAPLLHAQEKGKMADAPKLSIVTSFTILADVARQIGGDRVVITSLVGEDADLHNYQAKPRDVKNIKKAHLILGNGAGIDGFMARLIASAGSQAPFLQFSDVVAVDEQKKYGADPHFWQSITLVEALIPKLSTILSSLDQEGESYYQARSAAYLAQLSALRQEMTMLLAPIPAQRRVIFTHHDALSRFAADFNFKVVAAQTASHDHAPSARAIAHMIDKIRKERIPAVFLENIVRPELIERIKKETGAKIGGTLYTDALTEKTGEAPNYIHLMRHNARILSEALRE